MRLCDVGAARTELGVISLTSTLAGAEVGSASFGTEAFSYALWGMALNNFTYERYTDAPDLLEHYDKKVDAVLFSGKSPYKICENQMNQSILMDYVPRHETTLYRVLLEITYLLKRDICRLSVDTYDKKMMQKLYKEIHVELREDSVFFAEQRYMDPNYKDYVVAFHRKN